MRFSFKMGQAYSAVWLAVGCLFPPTSAWAAEAAPEQTLAVLEKIHKAARQLDYSGVYTYQQGQVMSSSRIIHMVDGTGERERIEILDGMPREFIRQNDVTQCLFPEKKTVVIERRNGERFPALLLAGGKEVPAHYDVRPQAAVGRVAGRECGIVELIPRDGLRYGYRLCVDTKTDLLLKLQTLNAERQVLDQIAFNSIQVGDKVESSLLASNWNLKDWTVVEPSMSPIDLAKNGWRIPFPQGFQPITQVQRHMKRGAVSQLVVTDGLAAISVFIEPFEQDQKGQNVNAVVNAGAMNIFRTRVGDHWLTALGEVPPETLQSIAERTEYVPLAQSQ